MHAAKYLFGLGLLCSIPAFAGSMGELISLPGYNGLYLGGDIGFANLIDKQSTLYIPGAYDKHQLSATGFVGGGMLGYDYSLMERIKLGVEGFINGTALNLSTQQLYTPHVSYNSNMRYTAGVRLLPGYEFSPATIGHLMLGYSYGSFNIKDNGDYGFINTGLASNGFQSGLGLNVPCHFKNLSLRGDVVYTTYSAKTSDGLSPTLLSQNYYNNFATIEGNLSLIYKFL